MTETMNAKGRRVATRNRGPADLRLFRAGRETDFLELKPRIIEIGRVQIGVYRLGSEYYAYENVCDHQGGPACEGDAYPNSRFEPKTGRGSQGELDQAKNRALSAKDYSLSCPWHGVEYSLATGACLADKSLRLRSFPVLVRDSEVLVDLGHA